MKVHPKNLRVTIQQSVIPLYAVPLFEGIARTEGLELTVTYSARGNPLKNYQPKDVRTAVYPTRSWQIAGRTFLWDSAQWQLARRGAADVLVLEWNAWFLSLLPAVLRARKNGIRTVLWGHGYSKRPSGLRDWLRAVPARFADAVLLYESVTADRYRAMVPAPREVHHAANSLDDQAIARAAAAWQGAPERLAAFRAEHGLPAGNTLIFIGRLYRENEIDFLLQAFREVRAQRPACRLVLVGDDKDDVPRLKALAQTLGIADGIVWVGALYDEDRIAPWMLCADLFVYPRNVGLSLIHALNYGVPVLASGDRAHHNPEIHALKDGDNGVFVPGDDPRDYATAIVGLLADSPRRAAMREAARQTIAREFNMANMVRGFVGAIRGGRREGLRPEPPV